MYQMGYNPAQDAGGIDVGRGGQGETNFNRVYGWMNAVAKANGAGDISQLPPDKQAAAMAYAVGRLRTDSYAVDPSGGAWQRTGFAGYDKYLAGGQTGQMGQAPPPPVGAQPPAPVGTQPPPPVGAQPPAQGQTGAPPPPPVGAQPPAQGAPPTGGQTGGQNAVNMGIAGNAQQQMRIMMHAIGIDPDDTSIFGRSIQNTLQKILPAYMTSKGFGMQSGQGPNAGDNIEQNIKGLAAIMNGNGGFNEHLQNTAAGMKAQLAPGSWASQNLDEQQMMEAMGNITNLGTRGMSPMMQEAYFNYYKRAMGNEGDYRLEQVRNGTLKTAQKPVDWLRSSQWADLLR